MAATMEVTTTEATTTYPFTYTTFSGSPTLSFTSPSASPTQYIFKPAENCSPIPDGPLGLNASCVISNSKDVSDHAFWDLIACCNGAYVQAFGDGNLCTSTCQAQGQTWQELMSCLSERAPIVVCKPDYDEIQDDDPTTASELPTLIGTPTSSGSGSGPTAAESSGQASTVGIAYAGNSKFGFMVFGMIAVSSVVGMLI
jgi:hypothetical protein